jgi:hypothetical protein
MRRLRCTCQRKSLFRPLLLEPLKDLPASCRKVFLNASMPAANLTHLRNQISYVLGQIDRPETFHHAISELYELYSDLAYHPGHSITTRSLLPSYHVPALVSSQLEFELVKVCASLPHQSLAAANALWRDDHLEPRLLAAVMLGRIPAAQSVDVVEQLDAWINPQDDRVVLENLLERGTLTMRRETPDALLQLIQTWLTDTNSNRVNLGIKALLPLVNDEQFGNIPPIFRLLIPLLQSVPQNQANDLVIVLKALIHRTPVEMAFLIRQVLSTSVSPSTPRLVRRVLPEFPEEYQASLRETLHAQSTRTRHAFLKVRKGLKKKTFSGKL